MADPDRFPNIEEILSYFPMLNPQDNGLQVIRAPNFNIANHLKNILAGRSKSKPKPSKSKPTRHVPRPPAKGCLVNDLPPEILSWIFVLGEENDGNEEEEEEEEEEGEGEEEEDYIDEGSSPGSASVEDENIDSEKNIETLDEGNDSDWEDELDEEDRDYDMDGSDLHSPLPFQVLVSHVCRYWRQVAIETPSLWNYIDFSEGKPYEKSQVYIARSKGYPLIIDIDCTDTVDAESSSDSDSSCRYPDLDNLHTIFSLILPHVPRWVSFNLSSDYYNQIHCVLRLLSSAPSAPLLESLHLSHHEESFTDTFLPESMKSQFILFNNDVPKLKSARFWGVHIDWTNTRFLRNLTELQLAYHTQDVRPSFKEFFCLLRDCPSLEILELSMSGPSGEWTTWPTILPLPSDTYEENFKGLVSKSAPIEEFLTLSSLQDLRLQYHPPDYIIAILDRLYLPNLTDLSLDFEDYDYTTFVNYINSQKLPDRGKQSITGNLRRLKLTQLPCSNTAVGQLYENLKLLEELQLKFDFLDSSFLDILLEGKGRTEHHSPTSPSTYPLLPCLTTLVISGIDANTVKRLVRAREEAQLPLQNLRVEYSIDVDQDDEAWFQEHVQDFGYYTDSDDELELEELDDEEGHAIIY